MGMDLIVAVCHQRHPERTWENLQQRVSQITYEEAERLFVEVEGAGPDQLMDNPEDDLLGYVKDKITEGLEVGCLGAWDSSILPIEDLAGNTILVGGGNSWGDTPDGYAAVIYLEAWGEW